MRTPITAALLAASATLAAQNPVDKLLDRIVAREQQFLAKIKYYRPILETYMQETVEGAAAGQPPSADHYMIGRLDLSDGVGHTGFAASQSFLKRRGRSLGFSSAGFAQMVIPDAEDFNRQTYEFEYVRREFLGDLRCLTFDVRPRQTRVAGKFIGRIWVEDQDYRIVRFNGTYTLSKASSIFFHFDSWRVSAAPGLFVPAFVYIEDAGGGRAQRGPPERADPAVGIQQHPRRQDQ